MLHYKNLQCYFTMLLQNGWNHTSNLIHKKVETEKNGDEDGKERYKLINNAVYGETLKNKRNKVDIRLMNSGKDYLKWTSRSSYIVQKIFGNDFVAIDKIKITLALTIQTSIRQNVYIRIRY